ncbi:hypothetical protein ACLOJK_027445 [Asimina triloba]
MNDDWMEEAIMCRKVIMRFMGLVGMGIVFCSAAFVRNEYRSSSVNFAFEPVHGWRYSIFDRCFRYHAFLEKTGANCSTKVACAISNPETGGGRSRTLLLTTAVATQGGKWSTSLFPCDSPTHLRSDPITAHARITVEQSMRPHKGLCQTPENTGRGPTASRSWFYLLTWTGRVVLDDLGKLAQGGPSPTVCYSPCREG